MKTEVIEIFDGLKFVYTQSASDVVHVGLMVGVGSKDDYVEFSGISHFVEHMWFKGTDNRSALQIIEEIELLGGDFNAYTSKEETCVHISVLKDSFKVALEVLSDIYYNSMFPVDELEKEREVIFDEIESYEDSPSELIFDDFEEMLFAGSIYSLPILGQRKTLSKIDQNTIKSFYKDKFSKANIVISLVGNVSLQEVKDVICDLFEKQSHRIKFIEDIFCPPLSLFNVKKNRKTNQSHCVLGCKSYSFGDSNRMPMSMLNNIIGGPFFSSILNISLREKNGLTYTVESLYTPFSSIGVFVVYFGTDKKKVNKCYEIIQSEFSTLINSTLLDNNIERYRRQLLGQLALSYENNLSIMLSQAKSVLVFNRVDSFNDLSFKINSISSKILKDVASEMLLFEKMSFLEYC